MTNTQIALDTLGRLYGSFESGDAGVWESAITEDSLCIGSDPKEFWTEPEATRQAFRVQLAEMREAGITMKGGDAIARDLGDGLVLVVDQPRVVLGDGTAQAMRLSVVFDCRGDAVRLPHFHLSVGATNEDVLDTSLTT